MRRFVIRKVYGGMVRIDKEWYHPQSQFKVYDGRLDGMKFAFAVSKLPDGSKIVQLWGTAEQFRDKQWTFETSGPEVVDGTLPWLWWNRVGGER